MMILIQHTDDDYSYSDGYDDGNDDDGGRRQITNLPSKRSRVKIVDFAMNYTTIECGNV